VVVRSMRSPLLHTPWPSACVVCCSSRYSVFVRISAQICWLYRNAIIVPWRFVVPCHAAGRFFVCGIAHLHTKRRDASLCSWPSNQPPARLAHQQTNRPNLHTTPATSGTTGGICGGCVPVTTWARTKVWGRRLPSAPLRRMTTTVVSAPRLRPPSEKNLRSSTRDRDRFRRDAAMCD
jgi:hypothetical protein